MNIKKTNRHIQKTSGHIKQPRLAFTTFNFPIVELRRGYFSAVYFWREKRILEKENIQSKALMQYFHKTENAKIGGIDECLAILRLAAGHWKSYHKMEPLFDYYIELKKQMRSANVQNNFEQIQQLTNLICKVRYDLNDLWQDQHESLQVHCLHDGSMSKPYEPVLSIEGVASEFAHIESVCLGVLARATRIATNTYHVVQAARGKPVFFFADRFDRWTNQVADGYAALKAGAFGVVTDAMGEWWGINGFGTVPHALIALYHGNTAQACLNLAKHYPDIKIIAPVDFHNDSVKTSLELARTFAENNKQLWGVRLDTSETMVDKSIIPIMGQFKPTGVCLQLVETVRTALDNAGFHHVKIVVSGGFNQERIRYFEDKDASVDAYGVGSSLLTGNFDYTADVVQVDRVPIAKSGRHYRSNPNLCPFSWDEIEP